VLVLATRDVYDRFTTTPEARVLDRVVVKGKTRSLELLELRNPTSPENFTEIASSYAEAYAAYQAGEFESAEYMFERTSASDRPSAVMAVRCKELQSNPPERWEGAYAFLTK
jgi:adenylate cyclase